MAQIRLLEKASAFAGVVQPCQIRLIIFASPFLLGPIVLGDGQTSKNPSGDKLVASITSLMS
jgi:hypothetical protein